MKNRHNPTGISTSASFPQTTDSNDGQSIEQPPATNQYKTELDYEAFALHRLARILIKIAISPATAQEQNNEIEAAS